MPSWPQTSSFRYVHIFYLILIVGESMLASCSTGCWCAFRDKQQLAKLSLQAARSLQWHHQAGQRKSGTPDALQQHSTGGKDRDKEGHNRQAQRTSIPLFPSCSVWLSGYGFLGFVCLFSDPPARTGVESTTFQWPLLWLHLTLPFSSFSSLFNSLERSRTQCRPTPHKWQPIKQSLGQTLT